MSHHQRSVLAALLCASLFSASAHADSTDEVVTQTIPERESVNEDVRVTLGLGVANTTRYVGSSKRRNRAMLTLNAIWKNGWFAGFPRGIGYNFSADSRMEYGLRLTADMGRKQGTSTALHGLGDIGTKPELGPFLSYSLNRQLRLSSSMRYGAGADSRGMLLDLGLHYRVPVAERQSVMFGIATTYANSSYMQSYFGVSAAQAQTTKYALYTPGAGIREVDLTASYTYKIDRQWAVVTGATFGQLGNVVKAAPMTRSNYHNTVYVQANYTF